ncbi:nucleotidyltransferase domain-containing protein [Kocuria marina]|uniref:nucleotidyltransferase domain-containing protein n=1 Tax=Kocuria marina TaxID=223184 RepID=UPI0022E68B36|nr:nucleotidyltransferase domain-containing protein [Kocuria marina]
MPSIGPGLRIDAHGLTQLREVTRDHPAASVWLFGSALREDDPRDIDVLIMYEDRASVAELKAAVHRAFSGLPCDIMALTADEESFYDFRRTVGAVRLA